MIVHDGPQKWANVHVTAKAQLADLIQVDNSAPLGQPQPNGLDALRQAAKHRYGAQPSGEVSGASRTSLSGAVIARGRWQ